MPRKARQTIIAPNTLYHIVSRGNNQRRIFRSKLDYKKFLDILVKVKIEYPFYLYSCNLLPNHYHLEIETQSIAISKIMYQINFLYALYFHKRYKTSGHLFQGRFYSSVINKESYFWEASRYIDLNAVRAGLVKKPEDWPWSSYSLYHRGQKKNQKKWKRLIDQEIFLSYDGKNLEKSRLAYLQFVKDGLKSKSELKYIPEKNFE